MSEILTYVITSAITFLTTGGLASIIFFKQHKKLKESEVKAAEVDIKSHEVEVKSQEINNLSASNEEWIKLYHNCVEEKTKLEEALANMTDKLDEVYRSKDIAWDRYSDSRAECNKKERMPLQASSKKVRRDGLP